MNRHQQRLTVPSIPEAFLPCVSKIKEALPTKPHQALLEDRKFACLIGDFSQLHMMCNGVRLRRKCVARLPYHSAFLASLQVLTL